MNTNTRRLLGGLATAAVLLLGQGGLVRAASPSPTVGPAPSGPSGAEMLSIQPSLISVSAKPGTTATTTLTIRAAAALDIKIKTQGLSQSTDGGFKAVPAAQDNGAYSARTMITASKDTLSVKPGDTVKLDVNIKVPADAGEGTRYAILTITGLPAGPAASSNVGFGVELGVSAIVEIAGTPQTKTGVVKAITLGQALPGQPLPVDVSFLNTGTTHYGAAPNGLFTTATLQDASGDLLASADISGGPLSIIPTATRDVPLTMTPSKTLAEGAKYHIEVGVGLKDGTVFDRKAMDFTWSGGQVLAPTDAPVQAPPVSSPAAPSTDIGLILGAALLGAAVVGLFVLVVGRARRKPQSNAGAADK
jgi:hypothetical protein